MELKQAKHILDEQFQCAVHSSGQVRQFFLNAGLWPVRDHWRRLFG
jgi:hypothetical protein